MTIMSQSYWGLMSLIDLKFSMATTASEAYTMVWQFTACAGFVDILYRLW